jgi:3-deoxy-D-manno-octulosonic-acid transferase
VVAGCTHPGEEQLVLQACRNIAAAFPGLLLVIAPRDVGRAREVTGEAGRIEGLEVRVVDRVGELRELYGGADVAVIGGSFVKRGGHNPLEAFASGCPVVIGPHFENVEALVSPFLGTGALSIVTEAGSLGKEIARFLSLGRSERALLEQKLRDRVGGLSGSPHAYAAWIDSPRVKGRNPHGASGGASGPTAACGTEPHGDGTSPRIGGSTSARVSL